MSKNFAHKARITFYTSLEEFADNSKDDMRRVFLFSITHGEPADHVLEAFIKSEKLRPGDIFLDGGNEHYRTTERRQSAMEARGIDWIGMGVSGGYQSARYGPSITMGGKKEAVMYAQPALAKFAAYLQKDDERCIAYVGPGGAGHYVKMVHNGIEQGMLGALCEAISLLRSRLDLDEIANVMEKWDKERDLRGTYVIRLSSVVAAEKKSDGDHVIHEVLDKVVQDDDDSEGTGYWTLEEMAKRHVASPSIASAHFMRVASGNRAHRLDVQKRLQGTTRDSPASFAEDMSTEDMLNMVRKALKSAFLASYCQGLELIARASKQEGWSIDLSLCLKAWRGGCIIQSDALVEPLLDEITHSTTETVMDTKMLPFVSNQFQETLPDLKRCIVLAVTDDFNVPTLSATLEYVKYVGSKHLPTDFMEALLDAFGKHAYDRPGIASEDPGKIAKGSQHHEWVKLG